jgi:cytochrome c553
MHFSRQGTLTVIVTVVVLMALFYCASPRQGSELWAEEATLSESAQAGKVLFEEVNCLMCHLLHGEGGGLEDAPDLAGVAQRLQPDAMKTWLAQHLYEEPRLSMFEEDPTDQDIAHLTDYLQTL